MLDRLRALCFPVYPSSQNAYDRYSVTREKLLSRRHKLREFQRPQIGCRASRRRNRRFFHLFDKGDVAVRSRRARKTSRKSREKQRGELVAVRAPRGGRCTFNPCPSRTPLLSPSPRDLFNLPFSPATGKIRANKGKKRAGRFAGGQGSASLASRERDGTRTAEHTRRTVDDA